MIVLMRTLGGANESGAMNSCACLSLEKMKFVQGWMSLKANAQGCVLFNILLKNRSD